MTDGHEQRVAGYPVLLQKVGTKGVVLVENRDENISKIDDLFGRGFGVKDCPLYDFLEAEGLYRLIRLHLRHLLIEVVLYLALHLLDLYPAFLENTAGGVEEE